MDPSNVVMGPRNRNLGLIPRPATLDFWSYILPIYVYIFLKKPTNALGGHNSTLHINDLF